MTIEHDTARRLLDPMFVARRFDLTDEQRRAVQHEGDLGVLAAPGSGKTRMLVARAVRMLADPDRQVVLTTFTRAAADELRERIRDPLEPLDRGAMKRLRVGTFDSLLVRQARTGGLSGIGRPPTQLELDRVRYQLRQEFGSSDDPSQAPEALVEQGSHRLDPYAAGDLVSRCYRHYERLMQQSGLTDFAQTARAVIRAMQCGELEPFDAGDLLVDEFQDADELQLEWLRLHADAGVNVTVVGDDDQTIYGWRGALGSTGFGRIYRELGAERVDLTRCYRCPPRVLEVATRVVSRNGSRIPKDLRSQSTDPGRVDVQLFSDWGAERQFVAHELSQWLPIRVHTGVDGPSAAVLVRTNRLADDLEGSLMTAGIRVQRIGGRSLWSSEGAALTRSVVELLEARERLAQRRALLAVAHFFRISDRRMKPLLEHVERHGLDQGGRPPGFRGDAGTMIRELIQARSAAQSRQPDGALSEVIRAFNRYTAAHPGARLGAALACLEVLRATRGRTLNARLFKRLSMERNNQGEEDSGEERSGAQSPPRVTLGTLHASKGLEFDWVWMPAIDDGRFPSRHASSLEEERRLFFVGATRARDWLVLTASNPSPLFHEATG